MKRIPSYNKEFYDKLKLTFPGYKEINKNFSQSWQDIFILTVLNGKQNGTYIEIGAQHSSIKNNTYLLEKMYGWTGFSIEINPIHKEDWETNRSNPLILADATTLDYSKLIEEHKLPNTIDYLQLDVEPADVTFSVLERIPLNDYRFNVITYEHDLYAGGNGAKLQKESRNIFKNAGYKMVVGNVCNSPGKPFEDWWVSEELIDRLEILENYNLPAAYYFLKS